jgi:type IV pilus assembly protein PilV
MALIPDLSLLKRRRQTGFSLIEVLVALAVLSIGLLGLAMLQVTGMKFNSDAYFRTQATILAYDIIDRMRANPKGAGDGNYDIATKADMEAKLTAYESCKSSGCNCDTATCSSTANIAIYDLAKWHEAQQKTLPQFDLFSTIDKDGNQHTITIRWRERDLAMSQTWVVEL